MILRHDRSPKLLKHLVLYRSIIRVPTLFQEMAEDYFPIDIAYWQD